MELTLLKDIVIIFALSTVVNFFFTKINFPTIIGYMLTGIVAGPHLLGLIESAHEIELMAEIGVVLLLFSIGMEFSMKQLYRIRKVVFFGGMFQVFVTAAVFYGVSYFYELSWKGGLFIGFLAALSSSAIVLKLLQERSEISSNYGRTVLGILIFQDLMLVPLILFANLLGEGTSDLSGEVLILVLKMVLILAFVYVGNKWLLPKLLHLIAMVRNQELFMMSILVICLGIALITSELGLSLAFGAFLAGLMISESEYSHNAFGNLVPFKDTFTSFFFVSIGMLLNLNFVFENYKLVLFSIFMVIGLKTIIAGGTGFLLGHTFRGTVMIGLALSQVGEFSFILAKLGLSYEIISDFHYQLFLAVAVITMSVTPMLIHVAGPLSNRLLKLPLPRFWREGLFPLQEI
ncbi:MAG: cation:proton antiporter, partial [Bacteroidota bacterium]